MYRTSDGNHLEDNESDESPQVGSSLDNKGDARLGVAKAQQKTGRQSEMARIRQLERRKSKRRSEQRKNSTGVSENSLEDEELLNYPLMYIAHAKPPELWDSLSFQARTFLARYHPQEADLSFASVNDIKECIRLRFINISCY